MDQGKSMEYNLDQFKIITAQLVNLDKKVDVEEQIIIPFYFSKPRFIFFPSY